ncbi:uncharacterized protein LOC110368235 [Fundulus heteroclitus]|uniref:uncharacterized protein LOC110368235 n=1 Tax=Fundulus heteroclitus TaxID=8078 RepID=UPI00165A62C1|nr:uncharacterized protein LOC110368235 [Fundulus heteroclitus]
MSEAARVVTNAQIHADGHSTGSTQTLQHGTRFADLAGRDLDDIVLTQTDLDFLDGLAQNSYQNPYQQLNTRQPAVCSDTAVGGIQRVNKLRRSRPRSETRQESSPKREPVQVIDLVTPLPVRRPLFSQTSAPGILPAAPKPRQPATAAVQTSLQNTLIRTTPSANPTTPRRDPPAAAAAGDNTELHATSTPPSNALDAIQRRPNLVELCSTLEKFHQVIPILVKKVVTLRRLVAESDSIIQQIPFYDHEATYYCLKSEELLKTCTFLLKEISKASTLQ